MDAESRETELARIDRVVRENLPDGYASQGAVWSPKAKDNGLNPPPGYSFSIIRIARPGDRYMYQDGVCFGNAVPSDSEIVRCVKRILENLKLADADEPTQLPIKSVSEEASDESP